MLDRHANGLRIPLMVDTAILLAGIVTASMMYRDVQQLKTERVSETRVVAMEEQLKYIHQTIKEMKDQQREDTKRVIDTIVRERMSRTDPNR